MNETEFDKHITFKENLYNRKFKSIKEKQCRKIAKLKDRQHVKHKCNSGWLTNCTGTDLPTNVAYCLSLGPKFNFPTIDLKADIFNTIKNIENMMFKFQEAAKNAIRKTMVQNMNFISRYKQTFKEKIKNGFYLKILNQTRKFIKNNPDIIITNADKGQTTVLMWKTEYEQKAEEHLSDPNTYRKLARNPTKRYEKEANKLIEGWYKNIKISEDTKNKLLTKNAKPPRIYFLPKIHKQGRPFRPIVSSINAPTYKLSKYLCNILSKVLGKKTHSIKNSMEFVDKIKTANLTKDHQLISLDVTSLYTNIPNTLVEKSIRNQWHAIKKHTDLSVEEFLEGVNLCLNTTYFLYNNQYYQQTFGCAMGTPLSSTVANLTMEMLEDECLSKLSEKPAWYFRYVDDIVTTYPKEKTDELVAIFNNYEPRLKFTVEHEKDGKLAFLDTMLIRNEGQGQLKVNWYQKTSHSWRYIHYFSNHPMKQKVNVLKNTIKKALIISAEEFHTENLAKIKNAFRSNEYPHSIIESCIREVKQMINEEKVENAQKRDNDIDRKGATFIPIPYTNKGALIYKKTLKPYRITPAYVKSGRKASLFTNTKDKIEKGHKENVVYSVQCKDCNATYIGSTSQPLKNRLTQHRSDTVKKPQSTALAKHSNEKKHTFNYDSVKVLETENSERKRLMLEMLHIKTSKQACNNRKDVADLVNEYDSILSKIAS